MLLNQSEVIVRGDQQIYLAGIDDAHCFKVDNIEKAALQIPYGELSRSSPLSRTTYFFTEISFAAMIASIARVATKANHQILSNWLKRATSADSEEKHEPVSDIDTAVVDSLKGSG